MTIGMQGPESAGFGAPGVNAPRPATTQTSQSERRVSKDRSFDDQLDASLSDAADDEDSAADVDAAAMPIVVLAEVVPAPEALPAPFLPLGMQAACAGSGEVSEDGEGGEELPSTPGNVAQDVSLSALTSIAQDVSVREEPAADQLGQLTAQDATATRPDVKAPQHAAAQTHAAEPIENFLDPLDTATDPETKVKPDAAEAIPADAPARRISVPMNSGHNQFDASDERRKEGQTATGAPQAAPLPDIAADVAKPAPTDLHVPPAPEPSLSMMHVVARPVAAAGVQFQAAVGSDVEAPPSVEAPRGPVLPETADSIIQSLRMQYQRGGGDAVVHIKPEHLGPVSVSLRVENGVVSAVVNADNPAVADWLKANEHVLREGLASSGLHLERFAVRRDGQPSDDQRRAWRQPEPPERRRRSLQPESTFEVTV